MSADLHIKKKLTIKKTITMNKEEAKIERDCRKLALRNRCILAKIENNGYSGIPDDLFISADGSKIFLIEFKKNNKQHLRQEQKVWFERFPHLCFRCNSIDDFKKITGLE